MLTKSNSLESFLSSNNILTDQQILETNHIQKRTSESFQDILLNQKYITEQEILSMLAQHLQLPIYKFDSKEIDIRLGQIIPYRLVKQYSLVPVKEEQGVLYIAMSDPFQTKAIEDIKLMVPMKVAIVLADRQSIQNAIQHLYKVNHTDAAIKELEHESVSFKNSYEVMDHTSINEVDMAPIVRIVKNLMDQAVFENASDIHIEPFEKEVRIRFRIDGKLQNRFSIPLHAHAAVVTRIKIMANMDIAEKRAPQDGRIEQMIAGKNIDMRISMLPTIYGEKTVMRILDRSSFLYDKNQIGLSEENAKLFNLILKSPQGLVLITGPTGSGKSTTLYTMLQEMNTDFDNIITIEDPVEYIIDGISQMQVSTKSGLTFATALRSILRQDPDIIMVGEIRDDETAGIAVRASITGHLVLSTLHTNDAVSTVSRLLDMGIAPYLLASAITGIISQRLLRKLCPNCKQGYEPDVQDLMLHYMYLESGFVFFKPAGCEQCNYTGYKGRTAVHEILLVTKEMRKLIHDGASEDVMRIEAQKQGMILIKDECVKLLRQGITSFKEVAEAAYSHDA